MLRLVEAEKPPTVHAAVADETKRRPDVAASVRRTEWDDQEELILSGIVGIG